MSPIRKFILINQAIHHLDQLRYLFGNVKRLAGRTANLTHQGVIEVEDTAAFVDEFGSGLFGTVAALRRQRRQGIFLRMI